MRRIRKGDEVIVVAGKDKRRRGKITQVMSDERVIVAGINITKRHTKPDPARGVAGGIVEREAAIHVSNVMLFNTLTKKGGRVGFRVLEGGRKVRYFKSNNEVIDV